MVSKADIARALGVSRMQACRWVKQGCPQTSIEDAKKWRENTPLKRTAVNPRSHKAKVVEIKRDEPKKPSKAVVADIAPRTGDSLKDALEAAIRVSERAYAEYVAACESGSPHVSARLSEHSKALEARLKAEKAYREELEHRKLLVNRMSAIEITRVAIEAVLKRVKRLPQESGPMCNPQDPLLATRVLDRAVSEIMSVCQKEINALR